MRRSHAATSTTPLLALERRWRWRRRRRRRHRPRCSSPRIRRRCNFPEARRRILWLPSWCLHSPLHYVHIPLSNATIDSIDLYLFRQHSKHLFWMIYNYGRFKRFVNDCLTTLRYVRWRRCCYCYDDNQFSLWGISYTTRDYVTRY